MAKKTLTNQSAETSLSKVYRILYERQEEQDSYLTYEQAEEIIRSTPGLIFQPDTTYKDIFNELENYKLVCLDKIKERIFVISQEPLAQSKPKYKKGSLEECTDQEKQEIEKTIKSFKQPVHPSKGMMQITI
jgi:hypothetical protein